jgi:hypothetical protein
MAKDKNDFSHFDTPYQTQPPKGAAEGPIDYGQVASVASKDVRDPMGVLPEGGGKNIGPKASEG